ncbi:hypothetical protein BS17DRAFT_94907 [Gyrodon lividus]|nr:hypothetical protein BS17DRAFT_94907 [Gyrodon lividus]
MEWPRGLHEPRDFYIIPVNVPHSALPYMSDNNLGVPLPLHHIAAACPRLIKTQMTTTFKQLSTDSLQHSEQLSTHPPTEAAHHVTNCYIDSPESNSWPHEIVSSVHDACGGIPSPALAKDENPGSLEFVRDTTIFHRDMSLGACFHLSEPMSSPGVDYLLHPIGNLFLAWM